VTETENYRLEVVFRLPQLESLDGTPVSSAEKILAENLHGKNQPILDAVKGVIHSPESSIVNHKDESRVLPEKEYWRHLAEEGFLTEWEPFLQLRREAIPANLDFSGIRLGQAGLWMVAQILVENSHIVSLNLSGALSKNVYTTNISVRKSFMFAFELGSFMSSCLFHLEGTLF